MMNRTLIAGAVLSSLILGACATSQPPPTALVEARSTLRQAELDYRLLQNWARLNALRGRDLFVDNTDVAEPTAAGEDLQP